MVSLLKALWRFSGLLVQFGEKTAGSGGALGHADSIEQGENVDVQHKMC